MAFQPQKSNSLKYRNIFYTQKYNTLNNTNFNSNSPKFQPINQNYNNQILVNNVLPVRKVQKKTLTRNNSNFVVPLSYSNKIVGYNSNNIYQIQPQITNIYQLQNLNQNINYQIPVNNIYPTTNPSINPYYSNLLGRTGIRDEDFLREKPFYNRPSELLPAIKNKAIPKKTYNASLIPNHYIFPRKRNPKPPSNNNPSQPPQPPQPPKPPKSPVNKAKMIEKLNKKIDKDTKDMLKRQEELRNNINPQIQQIKKPEEIEKEKNDKLNQILEDMCIYGNTAKEKIIEEKQKNPEKFIPTNKALEKGKEDPELFALGLIASILEKNEIETAIVNDDYIKKEKEKENIKVMSKEEIQKQIEKEEQEDNEAITSLQFLTNGWIGKKKYDLSFDFDDNKVNDILFDPIEYNNFKEKLKNKICKDYNVPKDKIIVTFPQIGSLQVQVIF